jgi:hypothetical protein
MRNGMSEEQLERLRVRRAGLRQEATEEAARRVALQNDGSRWFNENVARHGGPTRLAETVRRWAAGNILQFVWAEWIEDEHPDNYVSEEARESHWPHWYAGMQEAARAFATAHDLVAAYRR